MKDLTNSIKRLFKLTRKELSLKEEFILQQKIEDDIYLQQVIKGIRLDQANEEEESLENFINQTGKDFLKTINAPKLTEYEISSPKKDIISFKSIAESLIAIACAILILIVSILSLQKIDIPQAQNSDLWATSIVSSTTSLDNNLFIDTNCVIISPCDTKHFTSVFKAHYRDFTFFQSIINKNWLSDHVNSRNREEKPIFRFKNPDIYNLNSSSSIVKLDKIPDTYEEVTIAPVASYNEAKNAINSVLRKVNNNAGESVYTNFDWPIAMVDFDTSNIDTNFVCRAEMVMVTNNSCGDDLLYHWINHSSDNIDTSRIINNVIVESPNISFGKEANDFITPDSLIIEPLDLPFVIIETSIDSQINSSLSTSPWIAEGNDISKQHISINHYIDSSTIKTGNNLSYVNIRPMTISCSSIYKDSSGFLFNKSVRSKSVRSLLNDFSSDSDLIVSSQNGGTKVMKVLHVEGEEVKFDNAQYTNSRIHFDLQDSLYIMPINQSRLHELVIGRDLLNIYNDPIDIGTANISPMSKAVANDKTISKRLTFYIIRISKEVENHKVENDSLKFMLDCNFPRK